MTAVLVVLVVLVVLAVSLAGASVRVLREYERVWSSASAAWSPRRVPAWYC
jgi:hypothetical protein